ncbi:hypothetical protein D3C87_2067870 [compost metagenome]
MNDLFDRQFDEGGRVVGVGDLDAIRQRSCDTIQLGLHAGCRIERIGAGCKVNGKTGCRLGVGTRTAAIGLLADLDASHIT